MRKLYLFLFCIFLFCSSHAQKKYIDSLKAILANTTDPLEKFTLLVKMEENNYTGGDGNIDSLTGIKLHAIAQKLNNDSLLAISYNWIGDYFLFNKGDNTTALEYFFKGLPLAEKSKDPRRISSYYFDISGAYANMNNVDEAIKYAQKGAANLPDPKSSMYDYMVRQYQISMATYYITLNKPDSAMHYVQALNETNLRLKNISFEAYAQNCFGEVYNQLGDKVLAEVFFQKANVLADSSEFYLTKVNVKSTYANFLISSGNISEAKKLSEELYQLGLKIDNNQIKLKGSGLLKQIFVKKNMTDSAYYYLQMESSLKDTIFSQNNLSKIQALAFNEQIRIIDEKAKNDQEVIERKQNIQYALIALGTISLIILYLLLSRSFITNTKLIEFFGIIALLIVFEFLNLLLHPFLEKLTGHSPVFMLLILVSIAALLVPLHHRVEKWATKILVEKNKKIRLAAAKKTIQLLSDENLEKNN